MVKLVTYAYINSDEELESPFLNYLEQYSEVNENLDKLAKIREHIKYLIEQNGISHKLPRIEKYKDRKVSMLKINEFDELIRIAFVPITQNTETIILLLGVIEKPNRYSGELKKVTDKAIQSFLDKVERYLDDYLINGRCIDITSDYLD